MTPQQVQDAYNEYIAAIAECETADMAHTTALHRAYQLKAELELCERKVDRAWKKYERFQKLNRI